MDGFRTLDAITQLQLVDHEFLVRRELAILDQVRDIDGQLRV